MTKVKSTWTELNDVLRGATEKDCTAMLASEKRGQRRRLFLFRIYGRYSRLRRKREHAELSRLVSE